jgi:hypothetical protein
MAMAVNLFELLNDFRHRTPRRTRAAESKEEFLSFVVCFDQPNFRFSFTFET